MKSGGCSTTKPYKKYLRLQGVSVRRECKAGVMWEGGSVRRELSIKVQYRECEKTSGEDVIDHVLSSSSTAKKQRCVALRCVPAGHVQDRHAPPCVLLY